VFQAVGLNAFSQDCRMAFSPSQKWMPLLKARPDVPGRQARVVKRDRSREEESE